MNPVFFKYNDYREALKYKIFNNQAPTEKAIQAFSEKLGFKSSRSLGMTLSGYRIPNENLLKSLFSYLNLAAIEQTYIKLLIEKYIAQKKSEQLAYDTLSSIDLKLSQIQWAFGDKELLSGEQMELICNWPCFAIHQIIQTPINTAWTTESIYSRFTEKLSLAEVQLSLQLLQKAQLVHFDPLHQSWHSIQDHITTTTDIPSAAIQKFHHSVLTAASKSLKTEPVNKRNFKALTLKIPPNQMPLLKKRVQDFFDTLEMDFDSNQGSDILQIAFQSFFLTDNSEFDLDKKEIS